MIVKLYKNYSANDSAVKDLQEEIELDCVVKSKEGVNIMTPSIEIAGDYAQIAGYNYAYIEDFRRYYYIQSINFYRAGYFVLDLKVDVLTSFWDEFKGNSAVIDRQEERWNQYLQDNQIPTEGGTILYRDVIDTGVFDGTITMIGCTATAYTPYSTPPEENTPTPTTPAEEEEAE